MYFCVCGMFFIDVIGEMLMVCILKDEVEVLEIFCFIVDCNVLLCLFWVNIFMVFFCFFCGM